MSTVVASTAKLMVRLDLKGAHAELKALDEQIAKVQAALKAAGSGRSSGGSGPAASGEAQQPQSGGAARSGGGLSIGKVQFQPLNPLETALSAISAIPIAGPTAAGVARTALSLSEGGLPLVEGFGRAALKAANREELSEMMAGMLKTMQEFADELSSIKAKNDAIAPAYEAMKTTVQAQTLAGGTPGKELGEFGLAMWKVISSRSELDRKVRRTGLEALGEGVERLFEGMFR